MKILTKRLEKFLTVKSWRLNWITSLCKIYFMYHVKDVNVTYLSESSVVFEIN